jgi:IS30 family transposase
MAASSGTAPTLPLGTHILYAYATDGQEATSTNTGFQTSPLVARDRGLEMAKHKDFTVAMNVQVYFWDPQSPWQRSTNENTNLLSRQYFPQGTDLAPYSQAQLDQVSLRLNQRPGKTFSYDLVSVQRVYRD